MTDFAQRMNAITIEQLRATGATKWSATDDSIGAFVAEMDFGVDPAITAALHAAVDDGAFGYMPQRIAADLSDATAGFLERRYGWSVPASDVWGIPDVIMGLELAMEHCSARSTRAGICCCAKPVQPGRGRCADRRVRDSRVSSSRRPSLCSMRSFAGSPR